MPKIARTQKIWSDISTFLSNLAQKIDRIDLKSKFFRFKSDRFSIVTSQGRERFWEFGTTPLILTERQKLAIAIALICYGNDWKKSRISELKEKADILL
ncbi:MAG: hypothetical protein AAGE96_04925 [Cyanobacteria bacterium P01_G01_bin.19]